MNNFHDGNASCIGNGQKYREENEGTDRYLTIPYRILPISAEKPIYVPI